MKTIYGWIDSYARIGIQGLPKADRSLRYAFNLLCLVATFSAALYMILYGSMGFYLMAITCIPAVAAAALSPYLATYSERLSLLVTVGTLLVVFSLLTYFAGRDTLLHLFVVLVVLSIVLMRGTRAPAEAALASLVCTIVVVMCHYNFANPALGDAITPRFSQNLAALNLFALGVMLIGTMLVLSHQVRVAQDALAAEHARSEALLDNLLPSDIATRLKSAPGEIIADDLPAVTILFADIVDFTPRASSMPPEDVVRFLNRVFTEFDHLTHCFGLEKIKTIGDAYMVAAGMPLARTDHAQAVADMALAMIEVTERLTIETGQRVEVRIGLHSGAAIAGVIGTQKVFYDVWGDTVNTASRMESHGDVGRIQLTEETKALLGDGYKFELRGRVEIKGKGSLLTYWLTGKPNRADQDARASIS